MEREHQGHQDQFVDDAAEGEVPAVGGQQGGGEQGQALAVQLAGQEIEGQHGQRARQRRDHAHRGHALPEQGDEQGDEVGEEGGLSLVRLGVGQVGIIAAQPFEGIQAVVAFVRLAAVGIGVEGDETHRRGHDQDQNQQDQQAAAAEYVIPPGAALPALPPLDRGWAYPARRRRHRAGWPPPTARTPSRHTHPTRNGWSRLRPAARASPAKAMPA